LFPPDGFLDELKSIPIVNFDLTNSRGETSN